MSDLLRRQQRFAAMVPALIQKALSLGYQVTLGDCYRDPRCPYGSKQSKHHERCAIDLNLFRGGEYQHTTTAHRELGEWWMMQGGIWGGDYPRNGFARPDGNHYQAGEDW